MLPHERRRAPFRGHLLPCRDGGAHGLRPQHRRDQGDRGRGRRVRGRRCRRRRREVDVRARLASQHVGALRLQRRRGQHADLHHRHPAAGSARHFGRYPLHRLERPCRGRRVDGPGVFRTGRRHQPRAAIREGGRVGPAHHLFRHRHQPHAAHPDGRHGQQRRQPGRPRAQPAVHHGRGRAVHRRARARP